MSRKSSRNRLCITDEALKELKCSYPKDCCELLEKGNFSKCFEDGCQNLIATRCHGVSNKCWSCVVKDGNSGRLPSSPLMNTDGGTPAKNLMISAATSSSSSNNEEDVRRENNATAATTAAATIINDTNVLLPSVIATIITEPVATINIAIINKVDSSASATSSLPLPPPSTAILSVPSIFSQRVPNCKTLTVTEEYFSAGGYEKTRSQEELIKEHYPKDEYIYAESFIGVPGVTRFLELTQQPFGSRSNYGCNCFVKNDWQGEPESYVLFWEIIATTTTTGGSSTSSELVMEFVGSDESFQNMKNCAPPILRLKGSVAVCWPRSTATITTSVETNSPNNDDQITSSLLLSSSQIINKTVDKNEIIEDKRESSDVNNFTNIILPDINTTATVVAGETHKEQTAVHELRSSILSIDVVDSGGSDDYGGGGGGDDKHEGIKITAARNDENIISLIQEEEELLPAEEELLFSPSSKQNVKNDSIIVSPPAGADAALKQKSSSNNNKVLLIPLNILERDNKVYLEKLSQTIESKSVVWRIIDVGGIFVRLTPFHYTEHNLSSAKTISWARAEFLDQSSFKKMKLLYRWDLLGALMILFETKGKQYHRLFYSMCILESLNIELDRKYYLLAILRTLCSTPNTQFLLFNIDTANTQLLSHDETCNLMQECWCGVEQNDSISSSNTNHELMLEKRDEHFRRHKWYYNKDRCIARDTHNPGEFYSYQTSKNFEELTAKWNPILGTPVQHHHRLLQQREKKDVSMGSDGEEEEEEEEETKTSKNVAKGVVASGSSSNAMIYYDDDSSSKNEEETKPRRSSVAVGDEEEGGTLPAATVESTTLNKNNNSSSSSSSAAKSSFQQRTSQRLAETKLLAAKIATEKKTKLIIDQQIAKAEKAKKAAAMRKRKQTVVENEYYDDNDESDPAEVDSEIISSHFGSNSITNQNSNKAAANKKVGNNNNRRGGSNNSSTKSSPRNSSAINNNEPVITSSRNNRNPQQQYSSSTSITKGTNKNNNNNRNFYFDDDYYEIDEEEREGFNDDPPTMNRRIMAPNNKRRFNNIYDNSDNDTSKRYDGDSCGGGIAFAQQYTKLLEGENQKKEEDLKKIRDRDNELLLRLLSNTETFSKKALDNDFAAVDMVVGKLAAKMKIPDTAAVTSKSDDDEAVMRRKREADYSFERKRQLDEEADERKRQRHKDEREEKKFEIERTALAATKRETYANEDRIREFDESARRHTVLDRQRTTREEETRIDRQRSCGLRTKEFDHELDENKRDRQHQRERQTIIDNNDFLKYSQGNAFHNKIIMKQAATTESHRMIKNFNDDFQENITSKTEFPRVVGRDDEIYFSARRNNFAYDDGGEESNKYYDNNNSCHYNNNNNTPKYNRSSNIINKHQEEQQQQQQSSSTTTRRSYYDYNNGGSNNNNSDNRCSKRNTYDNSRYYYEPQQSSPLLPPPLPPFERRNNNKKMWENEDDGHYERQNNYSKQQHYSTISHEVIQQRRNSQSATVDEEETRERRHIYNNNAYRRC